MKKLSFLPIVLVLAALYSASAQSFNPSILQDTRNEPKVDGTFGFLYRTEDGIAHAAKGNANGVISGRFSYTDPTGLKVNYNYNAGSRATPGYTYDTAPTPAPARYAPPEYQAAPKYQAPPEYQARSQPPRSRYQYEEPQRRPYQQPAREEYQPEFRPQYRPQEPEYRPREPEYRPRRPRPTYSRGNELYDDY